MNISRPLPNNDFPDPMELLGITDEQYIDLLYDPLGVDSPLQLSPVLAESVIDQIPFFRLCEALLDIISTAGSMKLTQTGAMPQVVVRSLVDLTIIPLPRWVKPDKVLREQDCGFVSAARGCCIAAGMVKKRSGKLEVTKAYTKVRSDRNSLFQKLMKAFVLKFDWSSLDGWHSRDAGQFGVGIVLLSLLQNEGKNLPVSYFLELYWMLTDGIERQFDALAGLDQVTQLMNCAEHRLFECFLRWFGMVELIGKDKGLMVVATPVLGEVFGIRGGEAKTEAVH